MKFARLTLSLLAATALLGSCSFFTNPKLELSSQSLALGPNSWAPLLISNSGGKTLSWQAASTTPWLLAETADGDSEGDLGAGDSVTLFVAVDRDGFELTPGSYSGTIAIDSNSTTVEVSVSTVVPADSSSDRCDAPAPVAAPEVPGAGAAVTAARFVPDQLLVRFAADPALSPQGMSAVSAAIAGEYGFRLMRAGAGERADLLALPPGIDPEAAAARLADDPRVLYAEPNYYLYAQEIPDDPDLSNQWSLCRFGLPAAWDVTPGNSSGSGNGNTVIAIVDSGIDTDHEDLVGKILPGHDFCTSSDCSTPPDDDANSNDSHGTHVAGIAAATGDNAIGVAGVAYGPVSILPVKVFDDFGINATVDSLANGILWAIGRNVSGQLYRNSNRASIINLSLGGDVDSDTLRDAVTAARNAGAIVIAATGNVGPGDDSAHNGILAPANVAGALAVGSVNSNSQRSAFSMYDATGGPTTGLLAPGGRLIAAGTGPGPFSLGIYNTFPNDSYNYQVGTSMATPFVSGVAALIWSAEPGLSDDEVIERLLESTRFDPDWDPLEYGAGVLCADKALQLTTTCGD